MNKRLKAISTGMLLLACLQMAGKAQAFRFNRGSDRQSVEAAVQTALGLLRERDPSKNFMNCLGESLTPGLDGPIAYEMKQVLRGALRGADVGFARRDLVDEPPKDRSMSIKYQSVESLMSAAKVDFVADGPCVPGEPQQEQALAIAGQPGSLKVCASVMRLKQIHENSLLPEVMGLFAYSLARYNGLSGEKAEAIQKEFLYIWGSQLSETSRTLDIVDRWAGVVKARELVELAVATEKAKSNQFKVFVLVGQAQHHFRVSEVDSSGFGPKRLADYFDSKFRSIDPKNEKAQNAESALRAEVDEALKAIVPKEEQEFKADSTMHKLELALDRIKKYEQLLRGRQPK